MKKGLLIVMLLACVFVSKAQRRGWHGRQCQPYYTQPNCNAPRVFVSGGNCGGGFGFGFGIRPKVNVVVNPQPQVVYVEPTPQTQPRFERIWVEGHYEQSSHGRVWVEGHYIQREVY